MDMTGCKTLEDIEAFELDPLEDLKGELKTHVFDVLWEDLMFWVLESEFNRDQFEQNFPGWAEIFNILSEKEELTNETHVDARIFLSDSTSNIEETLKDTMRDEWEGRV